MGPTVCELDGPMPILKRSNTLNMVFSLWALVSRGWPKPSRCLRQLQYGVPFLLTQEQSLRNVMGGQILTARRKTPSFAFAMFTLLSVAVIIAGGMIFFKLHLALLMLTGWVICALCGQAAGIRFRGAGNRGL